MHTAPLLAGVRLHRPGQVAAVQARAHRVNRYCAAQASRLRRPWPPLMPASAAPVPRVVIVGGGFTGASAAVQAVRRSPGPLAITLVDPSGQPGRGLAYSTTDPDHRLNAPTFVHSLLPDDAWHFSRWCAQQGIVAADPQALRPDGCSYIRRADFGRYIAETLQAHSRGWASGATITHRRDTAVGLQAVEGGWAVQTAGGPPLPADLVLVATGHPAPRLPAALAAGLGAHPALIEHPLQDSRLHRIAPDARVLLVGSGLTALDVLSTLVQRGHRGAVQVVSRHGLRPRPQGPLPAALQQALRADLASLPPGLVLARLNGPPPAFLAPPAVSPDLRQWLRALRAQVQQAQAAGGHWYTPFDDLRDAVWQLWPRLSAPQRQRFARTLRPWYDVHRYRSPPQNEDIVRDAVAQGRIRFMAARLQALDAQAGGGIAVRMTPRGEAAPQRVQVDVVINCSGQDATAGLVHNPFLAALARAGWVRPDPSGIGIEVDGETRAVGADGVAQPALRVLGPPSVGSSGDAVGAMFIAAQIHRMLPGALAGLARPPDLSPAPA